MLLPSVHRSTRGQPSSDHVVVAHILVWYSDSRDCSYCAQAIEKAEAVQLQPHQPEAIICEPYEMGINLGRLIIALHGHPPLGMEDALVWFGQAGGSAFPDGDIVWQQEVGVAGRILIAINASAKVCPE